MVVNSKAGKSKAAKSKPARSQDTAVSLKAIAGFVSDEKDSDFHRLLNDRVRLGILSSLAVSELLSFSELKRLLDTSDGNLSVHARKLEDAGYIGCTKSFADRVPRTEYSITASGRGVLKRYLKHMEALIRATSNTGGSEK
jgi:DNA-binding HxlR family transcriptional regulator